MAPKESDCEVMTFAEEDGPLIDQSKPPEWDGAKAINANSENWARRIIAWLKGEAA